MRLSEHCKLKWAMFFSCALILFGAATVGQLAQNSTQTVVRTGFVTDSAGVLDQTARARLDAVLQNVQQKTGIEFAVVTVESTSGEDIFSFSRKLAQVWDVGGRTNKKKSLLLVMSVKDKTLLTQFSRSVQGELPDGVVGEMGHRMQSLIDSGQFDNALNVGIHHFVTSLAEKLALNASDFEDTRATSVDVVPAATPTETPAVMATPEPTESVRRASRERVVSARPARSSVSVDDAAESEEVELTLTLPAEGRIAKLEQWIEQHPDSKSKARAIELLVSAHAAFGDQRLKAGDIAAGIDQMMFAINASPAQPSEKLFSGVISQIPLNLYLRGERAAANRAAREIETKFGQDAKHVLAIAGFYLGTEQGGEAVRLATRATELAPDLAEAHQALGLAYHISLRMDDAVKEYKRALELDQNSRGARRALADLLRGSGKSEEALNLYRQQLAADSTDKAARAGVVLSLLDLGKTEEAKTELESVLNTDPKNLPLLAGTAYWFAAHNDSDKALELAQKAVDVEPRYAWVQVAAARALVAKNKPLEAERAVRFARQYGKFPTLDYELATALVSASLFEEAAEVLMQSFTVKDGYVHTRLAGHTPAQNTSFIELLAPERRASIFQATAADSEGNAKKLKELLTFAQLLAEDSSSRDERKIATAALEFASGDDAARVHRQLYAASRLLQKGIGYQTAFELAESARNSVDAGLEVPAVTVAVQADEYRDLRARAIAQGATPNVAEAPRNILSNILRGRIEDIAGWARFNQDKLDEAAEHLKRAVAVLPPATPLWVNASWHLGATLERLGQKEEALANYIKSYNASPPDPVRRAVIERLYRDINGSLNGLDERIGGSATSSVNSEPSTPAATPDATAATTPVSAPAVEAKPTPEVSPEVTTQPTPSATPTSEPTVTPPPESAPTPTPSPEAEQSPTPSPEAAPTPTPEPSPTPTPTPASPSLLESPVETMNKPRPTVVTISGQVRDAQNNPIPSVVVVLIGPQGSVLASTTDSQGKYSFTVAPSSNSFRLIPSKEGFAFEPVDNLLSGVMEDQKVDFIAKPKGPP